MVPPTPAPGADAGPLVSVVVPVYNVEEYLPRSLDSILGQTYSRLEVVLVNDGSPDGSGDIMRAYAARDPRLKLVFKENGGVGSARNAGVAAATGDYLAFVDPDDYVTPDYVARMLKLAVRESAQVVICNFFFELPSGAKVPFPLLTSRHSLTGQEAGQRALDLLSVPTFSWNKLYRRELFAGIEFPAIYYEDVATITRVLAAAERVAITHRPLYHYCLRSTSIVGEFSGRNVRDYLRAVNVVRQHIWDAGQWDEWGRAYRKLLRRVRTQLVISIESRDDIAPAERREAIDMVREEIEQLRTPPEGLPTGLDSGLDPAAQIVFHELLPPKKKKKKKATA